MRGTYDIVVGTKRVEYHLTIRRNITIIRCDSATGKTTLVSLIQRYYEQGKKSGVTLRCDRTCMTLGGRDWEKVLTGVENTIVFIDEGNEFIRSHDFARTVRSSSNYYVLMTRESIKSLQSDIKEVYSIKADDITSMPKRFIAYAEQS